MTRIDIVTAVRNEEATLTAFTERVRALPRCRDVEIRIVFVEDSSEDDTLAVLRRLSDGDPSIRHYSLERGFGQGMAIIFGLSRSTADAVIMMDVDGSHPIEAIPEMIDHFSNGAEVVQCRRRSITGRHRYRDLGSAAFQRMTRCLTGVDVSDQASYFRLVSARVARDLVASPVSWRFLRFPLPPREGGKLAVIDVDSAERTQGESTYGPGRLVGMAVDGMLSLMPPVRLAIATLLGIGVTLGLGRSCWWPAGALLALAVAAACWRYHTLRHLDTLDRMRVVESHEANGR